MRIQKRFGPRNFVQYLGLKNDDYALVPKTKKRKTEYIPGVSTVYRNDPGSQAELEAQQAANAIRFIPHKYEDQRAYRYTAKALPPVVHSFDRMADTDALRIKTAQRRSMWHRLQKGFRDNALRILNDPANRERIEDYRKNRAEWRAYNRAQDALYTWRRMRYRGDWDRRDAERREKYKKEKFNENLERVKKEMRKSAAFLGSKGVYSGKSQEKYAAMHNKSRMENKAAKKIAQLFRSHQQEKREQKQFEKRLDNALSRSGGTLNYSNGLPVFTGPGVPAKFSLGKAYTTPKGKKRARTSLDNTPTGVWKPMGKLNFDSTPVAGGDNDVDIPNWLFN